MELTFEELESTATEDEIAAEQAAAGPPRWRKLGEEITETLEVVRGNGR